jgi:hypothetical protein
METKTKQGLQVLRRVHEFLGDNEVTPALGSVTAHVKSLGEVVDRLSTHAVEQEVSDRGFRAAARESQLAARTLRAEFMRPVSQLGRTLFPNEPALRRALAMPSAQDYEGLIAAALAMADRAGEHKDRFVLAGFGEDFVDRIKAAVGGLRKGLDDKAAHFGRRSAATAGSLSEMSRGRELVRLLDVMLSPRLAVTPDKLAQWRTLSRFVRSAVAGGEVPLPEVPSPNVSASAPTGQAATAGSGSVIERAA